MTVYLCWQHYTLPETEWHSHKAHCSPLDNKKVTGFSQDNTQLFPLLLMSNKQKQTKDDSLAKRPRNNRMMIFKTKGTVELIA